MIALCSGLIVTLVLFLSPIGSGMDRAVLGAVLATLVVEILKAIDDRTKEPPR